MSIDRDTEYRELLVEDLDLPYDEIPRWISQDIDLGQIEAVQQGGCESGAYMPAVTYATALQTMTEHGDEVLQYLEDAGFRLPSLIPEEPISWPGLACRLLSYAVELWCVAIDVEGIIEEGAEA